MKSDDEEKIRVLREMLCRAAPILMEAFAELDTESRVTVLTVARDRGVYLFLESLSMDEFRGVINALTPAHAEQFINVYKSYAVEDRVRNGGPPTGPFPGLTVIPGGKSDEPKDE